MHPRSPDDGTPAIATDHHPDHAQATAACKKYGFVATGAARATEWGLILPMVAKG
ncbi:hypothetical protein [Paracoccus sediminilitoris]|uniref:hypothetical protein n=1 Tax=Paracoccus sediminilitoris TaxID=2202419 RepID=UPI00272C3155|nr:hypothetical protein [Paracoccus sediminilitoris]